MWLDWGPQGPALSQQELQVDMSTGAWRLNSWNSEIQFVVVFVSIWGVF